MNAPSARGVGYWIPRLLVLACLVDLAARFYPAHLLSFRGWEALSRYPEADAAFQADRVFFNEAAYGDLAALGNLPERRILRSERFTTDAHGNRNLPSAEIPGSILLGDSFSAGAGLDDDETLAVHLGRELGERVYNAGNASHHPGAILRLAARLGMRGGRIYYQFGGVDRTPRIPKGLRASSLDFWAARGGAVRDAYYAVRGFFQVSTLKVLAERSLKRIQDGRVLPNPGAGRVAQATLLNGDRMLFRAWPPGSAAPSHTLSGAYWSWLAGELKGSGFDLAVLLVPGKSVVYGPLRSPPEDASGYLRLHADLEEDLKGRGIPVVNLAPALSRAAREGLDARRYVYWPDDTHWNPAGVALAARTAAAALKPARPR